MDEPAKESKQVIIVKPDDINATKFLLQPGYEAEVIISHDGFRPSDERKK